MVFLTTFSQRYLCRRAVCCLAPLLSFGRCAPLAAQQRGNASSAFPPSSPSSSSLISNSLSDEKSGNPIKDSHNPPPPGFPGASDANPSQEASDAVGLLSSSGSVASSSLGEEERKSKRMSITIRSSPFRPHLWQNKQQPPYNNFSHPSSSPSTPISGVIHSLSSSSSLTLTDEESYHTNDVEHLLGLAHEFKPFVEPVKRIIFIRTGLSEANEDANRYIESPDWSIPLQEEGKRQSLRAGHKLASIVGEDPIYFYFSPYIRSRQTLRYVLEGYDAETRLRGRDPCYAWWEAPEGALASGPAAPSSKPPSTSSVSSTSPTSSSTSPTSSSTSSVSSSTSSVSSSTSPTSSSTSPTSSSTSSVSSSTSSVSSSTSSVSSSTSSVSSSTSSVSSSTSPTSPSTSSVSSSAVTAGCSIVGMSEDVRLRGGDMGRYKSAAEFLLHLREAEAYGRFFYRFPFGESGADVCDRATSFLDAFQRERVRLPMDTNVVIITHGLTLQMLIKRWFHLTVDTFHRMRAPPSGSISILTRLHHQSRYRLNEKSLEMMQLPFSLNAHNGYKYRNKHLLGSMSTGAPYM